MPNYRLALQQERINLHRQCLDACKAYAQAVVWELPSHRQIREEMDALYDRLAALDIAIASYDPQQALFLDYKD